ncbi:hypothetical protein BC827DRAFT_1156341 [Russula dissimulans]|nr:hypothetical protein BC827DRAFT_1156341 [Russula dissimulans]
MLMKTDNWLMLILLANIVREDDQWALHPLTTGEFHRTTACAEDGGWELDNAHMYNVTVVGWMMEWGKQSKHAFGMISFGASPQTGTIQTFDGKTFLNVRNVRKVSYWHLALFNDGVLESKSVEGMCLRSPIARFIPSSTISNVFVLYFVPRGKSRASRKHIQCIEPKSDLALPPSVA